MRGKKFEIVDLDFINVILLVRSCVMEMWILLYVIELKNGIGFGGSCIGGFSVYIHAHVMGSLVFVDLDGDGWFDVVFFVICDVGGFE